MDRRWLDQHVGQEAQLRPEFEEELASTLVSTWRDEAVVTPSVFDGPARRRPWQATGWAAALVVLVAGVGAVVATRPASLGRSMEPRLPSTTVPVGPPASTVPATDPPASALPTTQPTTEPATTAPATTPTDAPSTTSAAPPTTVIEVLPTDLAIPGSRSDGEVLQPEVLATIPWGSGPGQLVLQNGEFTIPVAVLADSILIIEDHPFQGFTGRVLELDRSGQWQRDLPIEDVPGLVGATPLYVEASPNGSVFVAAIVQDGSDARTDVWALRVDGDRLVLVESGSSPGLPPGQLRITPDGASLGDQMVVSMETGVDPDDVTTATETRRATDRIVLTRGTGPTPRTWVIDVAVVGDPESLEFVGRSAPFADGAWFSASMLGDPVGEGPFIAVLGNGTGDHIWFRPGQWGLVGADHEELIFTQATVDGLVLAAWPSTDPIG